jgi:hypothetical protein
MLGLAAGIAAGAALIAVPQPSLAAYGQSANIFGKPTNTTGKLRECTQRIWRGAESSLLLLLPGFVPYAGEGYAVNLPSKWNPSNEKDFPGVQLR